MGYNTLPIGTVIGIDENKYMISGYTFSDTTGKKELNYIVLPYPQGFINATSVRAIPDEGLEVLAMGYDCEIYRVLADYYNKIREIAQSLTAEQMNAYLQQAAEINKRRSSQ